MVSAGEMLRNERLRRNRTLAGIASETCICTRYLIAIEEGNLKALPGDFFYRSFLKQYAQALGVDPATTAEILSRAERIDDSDPLPVLTAVDRTARTESRLSGLRKPRFLPVLTMFAAALTCASGLYSMWHQKQLQRESALGRPSGGRIVVDVAAKERTWVSVVTPDGRTVFAGEFEPGQARSFDLPDGARLTASDAAAIRVALNGDGIGPIGRRGQSRVVVFSPNAFEIVPAGARKL